MPTHRVEIYKKALFLLAIREHSRYDLQQKLLQRGYLREDITRVLEQLIEQKFQSDERFAESYVYSRSSKGYGPERIRLELQQKGVAESVIDIVFKTTEIDWQVLAQKVYQKKFGNTQSQDFQEKIKRQQFMRYRGFGEASTLKTSKESAFEMWKDDLERVNIDDFVSHLRKSHHHVD